MVKRDDFDGSYLYGDSAFAKKTGRDTYHKSVGDFRDNFIDETTGLIKKELGVDRQCPLCTSPKNKLLFVKKGFAHRQCDCEMIYVAPILRDNISDKDYRGGDLYKNWNEVILNPLNSKLDKLRFSYCMELLEKVTGFGLNGKKVLDVGCGTGLFFDVCKENGAECFGVELNHSAAEVSRKRGADVKEEVLGKCGFSENHFDVITLWTVLEHIAEPLEILELIVSLLKPKGTLLIEIPNVGGLGVRLQGKDSCTFGGDQHISFFSDETLGRALEKVGLEKIASDSYISGIGTIKNLLQPDNKLELLSTDWINDNLLGHRLFVIARKI